METFISGFPPSPPTKRSDLCSMAVSKRDDEATSIAAVPHICQKVKAVITPSSTNRFVIMNIKRRCFLSSKEFQWVRKHKGKTKRHKKENDTINPLPILRISNVQ